MSGAYFQWVQPIERAQPSAGLGNYAQYKVSCQVKWPGGIEETILETSIAAWVAHFTAMRSCYNNPIDLTLPKRRVV